MAGRYIITGAQIGTLRGLCLGKNTEEIYNMLVEIEKKQFLTHSDKPLKEDLKKYSELIHID